MKFISMFCMYVQSGTHSHFHWKIIAALIWSLTVLMFVDITGAHYGDVIVGAVASQITSFTIVYSTVYSDADQRKHQSSASLAFVWGILRGPVNSPHKWPITRKMFPFDDVIMPQTLTEIFINVGICCSFRVVAARENYPGFILLLYNMILYLTMNGEMLCIYLYIYLLM